MEEVFKIRPYKRKHIPCFICYGIKGSGSSGHTSSYKKEVQAQNNLSRQLSVIYALQKLFKVPTFMCQTWIAKIGNPSEWFITCSECSSLIHESRTLFAQLTDLQNKFNIVQEKIDANIQRSKENVFPKDADEPSSTDQLEEIRRVILYGESQFSQFTDVPKNVNTEDKKITSVKKESEEEPETISEDDEDDQLDKPNSDFKIATKFSVISKAKRKTASRKTKRKISEEKANSDSSSDSDEYSPSDQTDTSEDDIIIQNTPPEKIRRGARTAANFIDAKSSLHKAVALVSAQKSFMQSHPKGKDCSKNAIIRDTPPKKIKRPARTAPKFTDVTSSLQKAVQLVTAQKSVILKPPARSIVQTGHISNSALLDDILLEGPLSSLLQSAPIVDNMESS